MLLLTEKQKETLQRIDEYDEWRPRLKILSVRLLPHKEPGPHSTLKKR
jgi:hypothetical protein